MSWPPTQSYDDNLPLWRTEVFGQPDAPHTLVLEAPHAANFQDWMCWREVLDLQWEGMNELFLCSTDQGVSALMFGLAKEVVQSNPQVKVVCIEGVLPRTLGDLNRVLSLPEHGRATHFETGAVGSQLEGTRWVERILEAQRTYHEHVEGHVDEADTYVQCHTYAPISVRIGSDESALEVLSDAYKKMRLHPRRPNIQLMTAPHDARKNRLCDDDLIDSILSSYRAHGHCIKENTPFALHPLSKSSHYVKRAKGRGFGVEWNRMAVAHMFQPFAPMSFPSQCIKQWVAPLVSALVEEAQVV